MYEEDQDRYDFVQRSGSILEVSATECYPWALSPNPFHLLICTGMVPVAAVMRRLLSGRVMGRNRRHRSRGQLLQNRYKSILCQKETVCLLISYLGSASPLVQRMAFINGSANAVAPHPGATFSI